MARSIFAIRVSPASANSAWTFTITTVLSERQVLRSQHGEFDPANRLVFYAPVPFTQFSAEWRQSPLAEHLQQLRQSLLSVPAGAVHASKVYAIFSRIGSPPTVWLTRPDAQRLRDAGWITALAPHCWDAGFLLQQVPEHRFTAQQAVLCETAQAPASPSRFGCRDIPWLSVLAQATRELPYSQAQELTARIAAQQPWAVRTPSAALFARALDGYLARLQDCDAPWPTGWPDHVSEFVHLLYITNAEVAELLFFSALFPDRVRAARHSLVRKEL